MLSGTKAASRPAAMGDLGGNTVLLGFAQCSQGLQCITSTNSHTVMVKARQVFNHERSQSITFGGPGPPVAGAKGVSAVRKSIATRHDTLSSPSQLHRGKGSPRRWM